MQNKSCANIILKRCEIVSKSLKICIVQFKTTKKSNLCIEKYVSSRNDDIKFNAYRLCNPLQTTAEQLMICGIVVSNITYSELPSISEYRASADL